MELLQEYLNDLKLRGRTLRTIQGYKSSSLEFLQFYPEPEKVGKTEMLQYLQYLKDKGKKTSTIQRDFSAISGLYDYLIFMERANVNPVLQIRTRYLDQNEVPDRRFIPNLKEVRELIKSMTYEKENDETAIREQAILLTLAKTASRRGEFLDLTVDDIDLKRYEIYWPDKKKRKIRLGFIDPELHDILEEYLIWRDEQNPKTNDLWISDNGYKIHKDYSNDIIAHYAKPLGLHEPNGPLYQRLTCHCFRGFFTTQMQRAGMQEVYIKWLRGDSLKKKTWANNYLEFDPELIRKEYLSCVPELIV
jgi:site-specific recombinase XerD